MKLLEEFGLNKEQISKFERYLDLLLEWNEKFNLTAITDKDEIEEKHFIDSIALTKFFDLKGKRPTRIRGSNDKYLFGSSKFSFIIFNSSGFMFLFM